MQSNFSFETRACVPLTDLQYGLLLLEPRRSLTSSSQCACDVNCDRDATDVHEMYVLAALNSTASSIVLPV